MMAGDTVNLRDAILRRWASLDNERQDFMPLWEDLSDVFMPNTGRFNTRRKGVNLREKYRRMLTDKQRRAVNVMAAGMQAGMASPARRWFSLQAMDPAYTQSQDGKMWFDYCTDNMFALFGRSNIYRALHTMYQEMGVYGPAVSIIVPDYYSVIRAHTLTIGEYALGQDENGEIDTLYREFDMTVGQIVSAFGLKNVSRAVKSLYDNNQTDEWITLLHAIEPRQARDFSRRDNRNMAWRSVYIEKHGDADRVLSESGFPIFPVIVSRWDVTSNDVYPDSPGMQALGNVRNLFLNERRMGQAMDQMYNPSLVVPFGINGINSLPGGITYADGSMPQAGIRRLFEINIDPSWIRENSREIESRINSAFFVDMFLMISGRIDRTMTATEVASLNEEKLMVIGPTHSRMTQELYRRLVEITFFYMQDAGLVPPPPEALQAMPMRVEFTSMMAQAMKASEVNTVDRFLTGMFNVAQAKPEVLDNINADRLVVSYADMLGVSPELMESEENVMAIREKRAAEQAKMQAQAEAQQQAQVAKDLSQASTSGDNALSELMSQYQGY